MDAGVLVYPFYPFLFLALFFETFLLITFLSKPARTARGRGASIGTPAVALIIPCFNEEASVERTANSALALEYPEDKLQVVLVDDGSTDRTREVMEKFRGNPRVTIILKENGGKHTALNAGVAATTAQIVGCLDADTFLEPSALRRTLTCFENPRVASAMSAISINKPKNLLEDMQSIEYIMGIFIRHALCSINAMYVTPGPFSLYRRDILTELGGFRFGQQTEDMEIALRIHRAGYEIDNMPRARVTTQAMTTVSKLIKQRTRWTTGFMRNVLFDYRDLFSTRYGALGLLVLPLGFVSPLAVIGLFFLSLYLIVKFFVDMYLLRVGIPLSWQLSTASLSIDWFYTPVSLLLMLAIVSVGIAILMVVIGKRISSTPTAIVRGLIGYTCLYGFIAPFWFMRAAFDVVTGTRRGWR